MQFLEEGTFHEHPPLPQKPRLPGLCVKLEGLTYYIQAILPDLRIGGLEPS